MTDSGLAAPALDDTLESLKTKQLIEIDHPEGGAVIRTERALSLWLLTKGIDKLQ